MILSFARHSLIRFAPSIATIAMALVATPALAEEALEEDAQSGDIIVTGRDDGYRTVTTTSGTKTDTPILDVPQSIAVVTSDQIADQQIRSMSDLVRLVPGLTAGQGEGNRDQINLRGNNSTADFFIDGLRDDVQYFRSFYNVERVEVHRGPNAMIFGRGGGGGVINRILKAPQTGDAIYAAALSADSFGSYYGALDVNQPLGVAVLRVNGFYESLTNHRDAFGGDRYGINPVVGVELNDAVRVQLGYEYFHDDRTSDRGIPSAFVGSIANPAEPVAGFRDAFFGVRGVNAVEVDAHIVNFRSEVDLSDSLTLTAQALYGDYDKIYTNAFAATAVRTSTSGAFIGQQVIGVEAYRDPTTRQNLIGQVNAQWRGQTGGIDHVLLVGAEYTNQDTETQRINGFFSPTVFSSANRRVDVLFANPVTIPAITFIAGTTGNSNRASTTTLDQMSFYIQDQISLSSHLDIIAALRYDQFEMTATNLFTSAVFSRKDNLWSPRVGIVYKPAENASIYASYTRSFLPQSGDQFTALDLTAASLEPEEFSNYEVGAKWDIRSGLTASVAIFRLDRSNTRSPSAVPGVLVQIGEQRTYGVEAGLVGQLTSAWQVALGYAHINGEITTTTSAAPAGRTLAQLPRDQVTLWNRYQVTDQFGVGLGLYHQSSQFASISHATRLPGYTRIDGALYVDISDAISAQLNVENILDETTFPNAHNDNNISTGAPRSARVTLNFRY
ncbi:MAG: TonB-dependent siderophore receptor [Pseudomonadota bacterium]